MLRSVIASLRQGSSCNSRDQRAHSPTEKEALLHSHTHPIKRYAVQDGTHLDAKRSRLAQLVRKQDHYTNILIKMEEENINTRIEIARYRAAGGHQKTMPSITSRAGSALLQSSIRNCMSPSEIIELYENEVEKSRGWEECLHRRRACQGNCGECRKYRMDRCWWCP